LADRTLFAFRAGSAFARALPSVVVSGLARIGGAAAVQLDADRRAQVERNLRRVHGPQYGGISMRRSVAATFESYARYWAEAFRLPGTSREALDAGMSYVGLSHLDDGLREGKGVILALPHLGGWEWAGAWVAAVWDRPVSAVVETLEPPEVFDWFVDLRREMGMQVIPLGPDAGTAVMRALKDNHVVCLLSDRAFGGGGVEVEFFGERTRLPGGPATLALRTGAPILPTAVYLEGSHHKGVVRPPIAVERRGRLREDVRRITQVLAHELEALIRIAPEQWHLMQPNWPSDPGYAEAE
jgi:KDO2-lipid IV(A) lauroyltransferase